MTEVAVGYPNPCRFKIIFSPNFFSCDNVNLHFSSYNLSWCRARPVTIGGFEMRGRSG